MDPKLGGVSQAVRGIVSGLEAEGEVSNEVASLDDGDASFLGGDSFPIHAMGPAKGPWGFGKYLRPWLLENLSRFDAVITHGLWQYQSHAVNSALTEIKKAAPTKPAPKFLAMPHGMLDPYFQKSTSRRLKALRNTLYWKLIEKGVANDSDGILFTCEDEKILAREPFRPYHPKREFVVGLGVESPPVFSDRMTAAFHSACPGLEGQPYFLFLSRIHEKKGVDLLLKAYAGMLKSTSGVCPALVIAGPTDSDYAKEMRALADSLVVEPGKIHFPGMLVGDAKFGAFYGCEVFVLPSHQENFGIAVVEALACGKPVLISDKVNIWREIVDGGAGLKESDTFDGTTRVLERWCAIGEDEKETMSCNARAVFNEKFTIPQAGKRLLAVLGD